MKGVGRRGRVCGCERVTEGTEEVLKALVKKVGRILG